MAVGEQMGLSRLAEQEGWWWFVVVEATGDLGCFERRERAKSDREHKAAGRL